MDISKDKKFLTYLAVGVSLGAAYWLINHLSNRKITSSAKPLSLDKTRKILQQIKYQILTTCTSFVEGLQLKVKSNQSQQDLELFFRTELAKVYEMRQDNTLNKYNVSRDEYASSLNKYKNDQRLRQGQREILKMLQNATKSVYPDFTVHQKARNLLSHQQVSYTYLDMCEKISVLVWQKLNEQTKNNPAFNSKNDADFKRAVRQLSIYDHKVQFLESKGFQGAWGCPNEVFFKVMESMKQQNKQIKLKAAAVDKAYQKVIDKITKQPQNLSPERIKFIFEEIVNDRLPEGPVIQPQQKNHAPVQSSAPTVSKKSDSVKKEDEFRIDELILQQLMSRSQEQLKQEQKGQIIKEEQVIQEDLIREQKEKKLVEVLAATQVVSVNFEIAQPEIQVKTIEAVEIQQDASIVQIQQKITQILVERTTLEVKVEDSQVFQQKEVQQVKSEAQQIHESVRIEQPEIKEQ